MRSNTKRTDDELIRKTLDSLDHPEQTVPATHYGVESRLDWADIGSDLPQEEMRERFWESEIEELDSLNLASKPGHMFPAQRGIGPAINQLN